MTKAERELVIAAADIPRTLVRSHPTPLEREELELVLLEELCHAAIRYDASRGPWRPFAWRFLRWRLADHHREHRELAEPRADLELELEGPDAGELVLERLEVRELLECLTRRQRAVVVLTAAGYRPSELAAAAGVHGSMISKVRARARARALRVAYLPSPGPA